MQTTQAATSRLADRVRADIEALWGRHVDGDLSLGRFRTLAAAAVARANTAGVQLADIGLAAEITRQLRVPTPPLGMTPTDLQVDQTRMAADIARIVDSHDEPGPLLAEWGASEIHLTVATAVQEGMRQRNIPRWTRQTTGGSCPLCTRWADGIARPVAIPMARHPGCDCIQQPVL